MVGHTALLPIEIANSDPDPETLMHQLAGENDNEVILSFIDECLDKLCAAKSNILKALQK